MTLKFAPLDRPKLNTLRECARTLRVGQTTVRKLIKEGELDSFLIGKKRLVTVASIDAYIERRRAQAPSLLKEAHTLKPWEIPDYMLKDKK